jgi:hypothetical protein
MSTENVIDAEFTVSKIIPCPRCGAKNRISRGRSGGRFRCGSCRNVLEENSRAAPRFRWPTIPYPLRWVARKYIGYIVGIIVAVVLCAVLTAPQKDQADPDSTLSNSHSSPAGVPPAALSRRLPTGTVISSRRLDGRGKLTIENGTPSDAVLKVVDISSQRSIVDFYVGANNTYTLEGIPDGLFGVYYTSGEDWDESASRFTRNRMYSRFSEPLLFETTRTTTRTDDEITTHVESAVWSLTLHHVAGGNAKTAEISEQEFLSK